VTVVKRNECVGSCSVKRKYRCNGTEDPVGFLPWLSDVDSSSEGSGMGNGAKRGCRCRKIGTVVTGTLAAR
jgi:hypothetical protein